MGIQMDGETIQYTLHFADDHVVTSHHDLHDLHEMTYNSFRKAEY